MAEFLQRALSEIGLVQNPALGAYALWKFGLAYQDRDGTQPILPLAFLVLPIVLHKRTMELVIKTNKASGLFLFAGKLGEQREELLALHDRVHALRQLTLESIVVGEQSRLLSIDVVQASIRANALNGDLKVPILPERTKWIDSVCEKLGYWFAAVPDQQVVHTLNVEF